MATLEVGAPIEGRHPATLLGRLRHMLQGSRPLRMLAGAGALVFALVVAGTIGLIAQTRTRAARKPEARPRHARCASRRIVQPDLSGRRPRPAVDRRGGRRGGRPDRGDLPAEAGDARDACEPQGQGRGASAARCGHPRRHVRSACQLEPGVSDSRYRDRRSRPFPRDEERSPEPYVSAPVENRVNGTWTLYLGRRISAPDGSFAGAVFAAIRLAYFAEFYGSMNLERGTSLSIWRRDGTMLVRQPPLGTAGTRYDTRAFRGLDEGAGSLVYETPSGIDGQPRLVARRLLPDFPLVVAISRKTRDALADWRSQSVVVGISGALVAAAIVMVVLAIARQFAAYERMTEARRETEIARQGRADAEAQLRQSQKLEVMGQLTSGVAHDFNNLLTVVLGNLDMLGRRLDAGADGARRYVDAARGGAERAAGLTRRLLAFSRRQALDPEPVSLNQLVVDIEDLLRQTLGENVMLKVDLASGLPNVFIDRNQLEAALLNLVVNARDAMPGGGTVTIETSSGRLGPVGRGHDRLVRLTVGDTGAGMTPEIRARAFEPFFTTKPPGSGTGSGLAQVHGFVKQSQGDVSIESEPGAGTRITLWLPPSGVAASHQDDGEARSSGPSGERVLVVDDSDEVRETLSTGLREAGFRVLGAPDGSAALRVLEAEPIDCLVTDIGLPGMDGRALAGAALRLKPSLAILLTTGYAGIHPETGDDLPCIEKPFTSAALAARIQEVLAATKAA